MLPEPVLEIPRRPLHGELRQVLFAGRLALEKRLYAIIESAERLPDIRFVIAGEGPRKAEVEAAAGRLDNLDYVGWLDRRGLVEQMDAADALVLPSEMESFGNVALEAMGRGRIAVVTDTCGIVNWERLRPHMVVFGLETPLHAVLSELAERPPERRAELGEAAADAAHRLNRDSLAQWLDLLAPEAVDR